MWPAWPSAAWPARRRCALSTSRASACTMALLAWAMAAVARARPASFWASWASSVSATSRASTSPFFTRMPSSASTSVTRRPSTSGPDQDLLARHQRAGGQHRRREVGRRDARDRHRRRQRQQVVGRDLLGARLPPGRSARGSDLADQRQRDHQEAEREHGADQYLSHDRPSLRGLVVVGCWLARDRHGRLGTGLRSAADQLQHGRHDGLARSKPGSTARRQNMPSPTTMNALATVGMSSVGRDAALVLHVLEQLLEALERCSGRCCWKISPTRGLRVDSRPISMHMRWPVGRLLEEILLAQLPQRLA